MSLLERTLGFFSPGWAKRRARERALAKHFNRFETDPDYRDFVGTLLRARGYRAASRGDGQTPWLGMSNRSADAEIFFDLPTLISRSRELNRDDPIGSGLTKTFVDNIVGRGLRPQARTEDRDKNDRLEAVWAERSRGTDLHKAEDKHFGQAQRLKVCKALEDGGVLVKAAKRTPREPVWLEVVEKDRIRTPLDAMPRDPNGQIRDGVERDSAGVPVAYYVMRGHPGDTPVKTTPTHVGLTLGLTEADFERVPKDVCYYLRRGVNRPGQTHGVPFLHAVLQDIRDLDLLMLATLKRTQIAACLALFVTTNSSIEDSLLDVTAENYGFRLDQDIEPGMIFKLFPGESVETLVPNFPIPELEPYVRMLARRIGAAVGVSWMVVLKDFSESNFASSRADLLEAWRVYDICRDAFIETGLRWEWRMVLEDARLMGDARMAGITDEDIAAVEWVPDARPWVDPLKDAQSVQLQLNMGLTTLQAEAAKLGRDWERLLEQRQAEIQRMMRLGLPLTTGAPQTAPVPAPAGDDPPESEADMEDRALISLLLSRSGNGNGNGRH